MLHETRPVNPQGPPRIAARSPPTTPRPARRPAPRGNSRARASPPRTRRPARPPRARSPPDQRVGALLRRLRDQPRQPEAQPQQRPQVRAIAPEARPDRARVEAGGAGGAARQPALQGGREEDVCELRVGVGPHSRARQRRRPRPKLSSALRVHGAGRRHDPRAGRSAGPGPGAT